MNEAQTQKQSKSFLNLCTSSPNQDGVIATSVTSAN